MYVKVVSYSLEGIDEQEYLDVANVLAPRYAGLPGLLAKVWVGNPGGNRYGAVYFWEDLESMDRYTNSELFEGRTPEFTDFIVEEFEVLENLSALTQPLLEIVEGSAPARPSAVKRAATKTGRGGAATKAAAGRVPTAKKTATIEKAAGKKAGAAKATGAAKAAGKKAAGKKAAGKKAAAKKVGAKKVPVKRVAKG